MQGYKIAAAVILLAAMLGACQQASPKEGPEQATPARQLTVEPREDVAALASDFGAAFAEYRTAVTLECSVGSAVQRYYCERQALLAGLQADAEARDTCSDHIEFVPFADCLIWGTTAQDMFKAAGPSGLGKMDWSDPRRSLDVASRLLLRRAALDCGEPTTDECLVTKTVSLLGLYPSVRDRCVKFPTPGEKSACVEAMYLIDRLRSALLYVG